MKKFRIVAMVLLVLFALTLGACAPAETAPSAEASADSGSSAQASPASEESADGGAATGEKLLVGVSIRGLEDQYYVQVKEGAVSYTHLGPGRIQRNVCGRAFQYDD